MPSSLDLLKRSFDEIARENPDSAIVLAKAIDAVSDPDGNKDRKRLAWELVRIAFKYTAEFDEIADQYIAWLRSESEQPFLEWLKSDSGTGSLLSSTLN